MLKYFSTSFLLKFVSLKTDVSEADQCSTLSDILVVGVVSDNSDGFLRAPLYPSSHVKLKKKYNKNSEINFKQVSTRGSSMLT